MDEVHESEYESEYKIKIREELIDLIISGRDEHVIEIQEEEQPHTFKVFSLVADLYCEFTKTPRESIRIFEEDYEFNLGTIDEFQDSKELWKFMKDRGVYVYS